MATRIIINADDYGLSDGICRGIIELFEAKAISNTTIMFGAQGARERCRKFGLENIRGRAGVHLQITSGHPTSPASEVTSIVDTKTGLFRGKDAIQFANPEEVYLEWTRQVECAFDLLGVPPTHIDSHHGAHRSPQLIEVFLRIASDFNLQVRGGVDRSQASRMKELSVVGSRFIIRDWTGRRHEITDLHSKLNATRKQIHLEPIEVVTHPGYNDTYLASISKMNSVREYDLSELLTFARSNWLKDNFFTLVKYPIED